MKKLVKKEWINDSQKFIDEYQIKKVSMNVASKDGNKIKYTLIIADNNYIIHYNIKFDNLVIRTKTTKSHFTNNVFKTEKFNYRNYLITQKLGLQHTPSDSETKKPKYELNDLKTLNSINKWIQNDLDFSRKITFQSIEYLLTGSNPSGQGNGTGYLNIMYNNTIMPFGLFLKTINKSQTFLNKYENWHSTIRYIYDKLPEISFDEWLSSNDYLDEQLKRFFNNSEDWKRIREEITKTLINSNNFYDQICNIASKNRSKYSNLIKQKYKNISSTYKQYFGKNCNIVEKFEYAHIKPVWFIKQQSIKEQNLDILDEISDINNFLPLPSNVHDYFDRKYIYWNKKGEMKFNTDQNNKPDSLSYFSKIDKNKLVKLCFYLKEYESKIINKGKSI